MPGDRSAPEQLGEEIDLFLEEVLVVGEVVAEERERLDAGASSEDDFRPTARDCIERGVALEHADGIVRAQYGDRRPDADAGRACGDCGEHYVARGQREVIGVVFADPEEVDANLLGDDTMFDEVTKYPGVREWAVLVVMGGIAEGVETQDERERRI